MFILGVLGSRVKTSTINNISDVLRSNNLKVNVIESLKSIHAQRRFSEYLEVLKENNTNVLIIGITHTGINKGFYDNISFDMIIHTTVEKEYELYKNEQDAIINTEKRIFSRLKGSGYAIINMDNEFHRKLLENINARILTYGLNLNAAITAINKKNRTNRLDVFQSKTIKTYYNSEIKPQRIVVKVRNNNSRSIYNALTTVIAGIILDSELKPILSKEY